VLDRCSWYALIIGLILAAIVGVLMGYETSDVFIPYGQDDATWVHALAGDLHRAGLDVFLDEWEIPPCDVVVHLLERGLLASRTGCWWSARRRCRGPGFSRSTRSWLAGLPTTSSG
jgi:hypothetical protein